MAEQTQTDRRNRPNPIAQAARRIQVTNEDILGDLLYPAPTARASAPQPKATR